MEVDPSSDYTADNKWLLQSFLGSERIPALEITGEDKPLTVTELRDFLNYLIEEGYGDYDVEADTQDGETYSVRDEVLVFRQSKVVNIF